MGANTKIEWAHHTLNPWVGCTKVSPACDHCYAESWARRTGQSHLWNGERRRTSAANWAQPMKWDRAAAAAGERHRVFCASLADVFDNQCEPEWRRDLFDLILRTPNLDWLLLTKRPQNIAKMLPANWHGPWPNVWLGTTVENQEEADRRIPHLLSVPAKVHFLSCEPLLGPVDLSHIKHRHGFSSALEGWEEHGGAGQCVAWNPPLDWVIAGGESGPGARPTHPAWFQSLRDQCAAAGIPYHFKQWGEWQPHKPVAGGDLPGEVRRGVVTITHPTGEDDLAVFQRTGGRNTIPGSRFMKRVGKKLAGRLLDGIEHNGFPQ